VLRVSAYLDDVFRCEILPGRAGRERGREGEREGGRERERESDTDSVCVCVIYIYMDRQIARAEKDR
jgi:hypothetical protein